MSQVNGKCLVDWVLKKSFSHSWALIHSICISQKHICDGHIDCPTGADEEECPIQHPCGARDMCEQYCITDAKAREACSCKVGFVSHENGIKYGSHSFT